LILDDETTICLDLPCVIGHLPPQDHVISGELARAVTLDDQKHRISRRHLEIHLVGWEARAVDCGSTNGTRFRRAGSRRGGPLKPNEPQPLRSGDELELGKRTLTFVDHLP
jgi:pSer/pThr/pTyr-binding forkhead associated (FHA) protein